MRCCFCFIFLFFRFTLPLINVIVESKWFLLIIAYQLKEILEHRKLEQIENKLSHGFEF